MTNKFTAEEYFSANYDIWNEEYILSKYAGVRHTAEEWEAIMDMECAEHPEWADCE